MLLIPFLCTLGLATFSQIHPLDPIEQIVNSAPQDAEMKCDQLCNGIKTYILDNQLPSELRSFRVILKRSVCDQVLYSFETINDDLEPIEQFFSYCEAIILKNSSEINTPHPNCFSNIEIPNWKQEQCPNEVGVIAVGNFSNIDIHQVIKKHFQKLSLAPKNDVEVSTAQTIYIGTDATATKVALDISYPYNLTMTDKLPDLREEWKYLLLQDLFQNRLEGSISSFCDAWALSYPRFLLPVPGYAVISEELSENALSFILWQIELMKIEGFSQEEFSTVKRALIQQLQSFPANQDFLDSSKLASYHADQFILGRNSIPFSQFLTFSLDILNELEYEDVIRCVPSFLVDSHRVISVIYPQSTHFQMLTVHKIEEMIQKITDLAAFYRSNASLFDSGKSNQLEMRENDWSFDVATETLPIILADNHLDNDVSTIFINSSHDTINSFYQLSLPEKEKRMIYDLIKTMAEKNIWGLLFKKKELERTGKKINHVHPLRFIGFILSDQKLRRYLKDVKTSSFKWDHFIDGFAKRMKEEGSRNNIYQHVPGLAHLLEADETKLKEYIGRGDYEGLVKFLM